MAVIIGSARIDERGKISGGRDGDNNGREVSTQNYYAKPAGAPWRVLRPKDAAKAAKIAACMRMACANDHIGYNQNRRLTLYNLAKLHGFDVSKVTQNCSTDCSALVRVCCAYAGIAVGNFTTSNEARMLLATGEFVEMADKKYRTGSAYLREGDVLVTPSKGHTAVVLSSGNASEPLPEATPEPAVPDAGGGRQLALKPGKWNLRAGPGTAYPSIDTVSDGEAVRVDVGGWVFVKAGDKFGWIGPSAISENEPGVR